MKLVRGRADGRWLPSRFHFALFRLGAFLRLLRAQPDRREVILAVDRHQSAFENFVTAGWVTVTVACFIAGTLTNTLPLPVALALAIPLAAFALHLGLFVGGLVIAPLWGRVTGLPAPANHRLNSRVLMFAVGAAAVRFAIEPSWVRVAAWQFLAFAMLNALAAVVVFALRRSIARLEAGFGVEPFAN